jgi:hypothetical protein
VFLEKPAQGSSLLKTGPGKKPAQEVIIICLMDRPRVRDHEAG